MTGVERKFWDRVTEGPGGCWLWTGGRTLGGYPLFYVGAGVRVYAHRWSYEQMVAPIPGGLQLDHLCEVECCVNPQHLEPVTNAVNTSRRTESNRRAECPHGHQMVGDNLMVISGVRRCRTCKNDQQRALDQRKRDQAAA